MVDKQHGDRGYPRVGGGHLGRQLLGIQDDHTTESSVLEDGDERGRTGIA